MVNESSGINPEPFIPLLKHYKVSFATAILQALIGFYPEKFNLSSYRNTDSLQY